MKKVYSIGVVGLLLALMSCGGTDSQPYTLEDVAIIPKPQEVALEDGWFHINAQTPLVVEKEEQLPWMGLLAGWINTATGWKLQAVTGTSESKGVTMVTDTSLENEAYRLKIDKEGAILYSNSPKGFIHGVESIRQLLPIAVEKPAPNDGVDWKLHAMTITDSPRFKWRGLMLDVSRHFFDKDYVMKTIDRLALLKMNTLHLHLVDDQGWRIEIKKYPKLTEVGAYRVDQEDLPWNSRRTPSPDEKGTYGGFYTQEDIKEIVAYATAHGIDVVPEIEMPAHVMSAVAAYPYLACSSKPIAVASGGVWPDVDIYCVGKESTFEFLEDVLSEVMDLFPSQYIHIGGDEATKTSWEHCASCIALAKKEGLDNVDELQSYFIKRIERFISSKGRTLIGWDEILEGGLAPGATVMSWRGVQGGLDASAQGHDVVMTPGEFCYFDHYQGDPDNEPLAFGGYTPISKVYQFDPVVEGMTEAQEQHVLGGQANLWSEYIPNPSHSEYMIFPRLTALSEVLWTKKENKDWVDFTKRLDPLLQRFNALGVHYAKSIYDLGSNVGMDSLSNKIKVAFTSEFPQGTIRYLVNDDGDLSKGEVFKDSLLIGEDAKVRAALFRDGKRLGKEKVVHVKFHEAVGVEVTYKHPYHKNYQGGGAQGLVDVVRGSKNFHDGHWQGWSGTDMDATLNLGEEKEISEVTVGALQSQGAGIFFPAKVEVLLSEDGKKFTSVGSIEIPKAQDPETKLKELNINFEPTKAKYIQVKAINVGQTNTGTPAWVFVDEILAR